MLSRTDVVSKYQKLFQKELGVDHPAYSWVDQLPPVLCRSLVLGNRIDIESNSIEEAFVGTTKGDIRHVSGIRVSVGDFNSKLFTLLPLDGHVPLEVPGMCDWLASAFETLQMLDEEAVDFVRQWCSMIMWVAPDSENPPETVLTSVAIPALPHCIILSVKSLRHIPANHVYERASAYALAENIFHEALHQKLSASLMFGEGIMDDAESANIQSIHIPWRNSSWKIDRVMHAAWVYTNLQKLRERALSQSNISESEFRFIRGAKLESQPKLIHLRTVLESVKNRLSQSSNDFINQVLG